MLRIEWLWLAALAGCGGAPFEATGAEAPVEGGAEAATPLDAGAAAQAPEAAPPQGTVDSSPQSDSSGETEAAPPLDSGACGAVTWAPPNDASTQGPFVGCTVNADPSTYLPAFYAVETPQAQGCFLERTPLACQCAGAYSCACLKANNPFCTGAAWVKCDESLGAPVVTCN
jgi:hypothetical protein